MIYNFTPSGQPTGQGQGQGGTPQRTAATYNIEPRRAQPPADMPAPGAGRPSGTFRDSWYSEWDPSAPNDPHDEPYSEPSGDGDGDGYGDDDYGDDRAAVASNIITDPPGPFSRSRG